MNFVLNLTWREVRSSWRRLLFFFICIGLGVGSIVALRSLTQNLNRAVSGEARNLLIGDIEINTTSPLNEAEKQAVETVVAANANNIEARTETYQTTTMSRPTDATNKGLQILELKGIENNFPLVGDFKTSDGKPFDYSLIANNGAICSPLLLERLKLKIGDSIKIGSQDFQLRGTFDEEPGGVSGFRLGPRVFIEKKGFDDSGLTAFGSRNRIKLLFRTSSNPENIIANLRTSLKQTQSLAAVRSYKEAADNTKEAFDRAENYLSLTGLVVLVLGGIGVWNVTRVFIEQKKASIAVLKCVGASGAQITTAYLLQILSLGVLGSVFGTGLAQAALYFFKYRFGASLPPSMSYALQPSAIIQGLLLGLFVSLLFAALPLLRIRKIKPNLLLRDISEVEITRFDVTSWIIGIVVVFGLLILAVWQANSWKVGAYFLVGLAVTSGALYLAASVLTFALKGLRQIPFFALRQSVNSLSRPGNQTRTILLAVGLGIFVILAIQSLQSNLLREFDLGRGGALPTLILIDVQRGQADGVKALLAQQTGEIAPLIPTIRGRIIAIDDKPIDFQQINMNQNQGQLGREYVLTYRQNLVGAEQVTSGKFWDETPSDAPEVSLEEGMKGLMNLDIGGNVTFDVLGQKVTAKVTSFRKLDVRNTRSTFQVVFRPGTLEEAPQTFIAPVFAQLDAAQRSQIQRVIVDKYPNVSIIDTADAIAAIKKLLDNFSLAISFVGAFVFFCGALILIGSISLTKFQRIYENAILKTLGAKRGTLLTILLVEYGLLGILASIIGVSASTLLSYLVAKYVLDIKWQFDLSLMLSGLFVTIALVMIVGAVSSFDVLLKKPLATLRSQ
ncbi:MAG: FtsX-like permease family protein [Pyrinomonadaceae bacterium]|nr:FtsX-like permease family protein [Pyrinomonadaceae bacterium]